MFRYLILLLACYSLSSNADEPSNLTSMMTPSALSLAADKDEGYYRYSRPDWRKCMSPLCGGFYVKAINQSKTHCADGLWRAECYVSGLDGKALDWDDDSQNVFLELFQQERALVRGQLINVPFGDIEVGQLSVSQTWQSATDKPNPRDKATSYYWLKDNGIRCITTPCPNLDVYVLNGHKLQKQITDVDLSASGASEDQRNKAYEHLADDGVIVAGREKTIKAGPKAKRKNSQVIASTFYLATNSPASPTSGQLCGGIQGLICPQGQVCDITPPNACHGADLAGTCITPPELCTLDYQPVCGCDGKTYGNDCGRRAAGVQLDHVGECASVAPDQ